MALKTVDPRFSVYVGGLPADVSLSDMEELLYELFLQVRNSFYAKVETLIFVNFIQLKLIALGDVSECGAWVVQVAKVINVETIPLAASC